MGHKFNKNIKCPYCGWEDMESHYHEDDKGVAICESCNLEFDYERHHEITYTSTKIECKENHDYTIYRLHINKKKYAGNTTWIYLPENKWQYYLIEICKICDHEKYTQISKSKYESMIRTPCPTCGEMRDEKNECRNPKCKNNLPF